MLAHRAGHRILVAPHDIAQIFRVQALGQLGRADQITKHDGQLPPFRRPARVRAGQCCRCWCYRWWCCRRFIRAGQSVKYAPARPQGEAKVFEVIFRQQRQIGQIDFVDLEHLRQMSQVQRREPIAKIISHPGTLHQPARIYSLILRKRNDSCRPICSAGSRSNPPPPPVRPGSRYHPGWRNHPRRSCAGYGA